MQTAVPTFSTQIHVRRRTDDSVREAGEVVRWERRSVLPHLVDQVNGDGLEAAIARLQTDVVVFLCF